MKFANDQRFLTFFFIGGSGIASLIVFLSVPLAIHFLGNARFAHLSIWSLLIIFSQLLDLGVTQLTVQQASDKSRESEKLEIAQRNNFLILLLTLLFSTIAALVPVPAGKIYEGITRLEWLGLLVSVALNLKINFNQNLLAVVNRQIYYTFFLIALAVSRFIVPILIYYYFEFEYVILYYISMSLAIIIISDKHLAINSRYLGDLLKDFKASISYLQSAFLLYLSVFTAIILAGLDRFIASFIFDEKVYSVYFGTFALASAINIAVLPFYRIFIGRMKRGHHTFNVKRALRITSFQSLICITIITFLSLFADDLLTLIGLEFALSQSLLLVLSLSLWGAANGWILATDILLNRIAMLQACLISAAMIIYFAYLAVQDTVTIFDLSVIWVAHGLIQTFICPIWARPKFSWRFYFLWLNYVIVRPVLICIFLFALPAAASFWSLPASLLLFLISALTLFATVEYHGLIDARFSKLLN